MQRIPVITHLISFKAEICYHVIFAIIKSIAIFFQLKNRNGTAQSEGDLSIRGPPEFTTPLKHVYAPEGDKDVKLFVEWDSNPRPSAKW